MPYKMPSYGMAEFKRKGQIVVERTTTRRRLKLRWLDKNKSEFEKSICTGGGHRRQGKVEKWGDDV